MTEPDPPPRPVFLRNRAVFDWCLRSAAGALRRGAPHQACEWCSHAAWSAAFAGWFGTLASPQLESLILQLGRTLPEAPAPEPRTSPPRWLHVVTTAYEIGGHTNMLCRWARTDTSAQHDLILTEQSGPCPLKLRNAIETSGGTLLILDPSLPAMARAQRIREIAARHADVVVLHHHPHDMSALVAFAASGGPPVLLMNHADHLFWAGVSVADLVLEFREIGQAWTHSHRGADASGILPLPLSPPCPPRPDRPACRSQARSRLGLPLQGVMLLAVASAYKFDPAGAWDFHQTVRTILSACPQAFLVAVGPKSAGPWQLLQRDFVNRVFLPGPVDVSQPGNDFYSAADIALGSFPFASQTSLLEAGLHGLPCVATPRGIPYGFDDVSFAGIEWPSSQDEYAQLAICLIRDPGLRLNRGDHLRSSIMTDHCGEGWLAHLQHIKALVPSVHAPRLPRDASPLPETVSDFWARFCKLEAEHSLYHVHGRLISNGNGCWPRHDRELLQVLGPGDSYAARAPLNYLLRKARFSLGRARKKWLARKPAA